MPDSLANIAEQRPGQTAMDAAVASILVYVDFDAESDNRIKIAADWARKFNASLIGVAGWLPGREIGGWFAAELEPTEERNDRIMSELGKLGEHFRNLATRTVQTVEWRSSFHFPRDVIPAEARSADLVVISPHPVAQDIYSAFDPGEVLLNAGRPVLVVPDGVAACGGQHILVAWKDTREARHAVQGALAFLRIAERVSLVEVAEDVLEWAAQQQLDDVERYLARHGVQVGKKVIEKPKGSISDQLMSVARSEGADLIVAGAYGHSRLGEWIFGGVTHDLLKKSDICCLLSN
jgi:nucleotide-binding universal stress UspA family protein